MPFDGVLPEAGHDVFDRLFGRNDIAAHRHMTQRMCSFADSSEEWGLGACSFREKRRSTLVVVGGVSGSFIYRNAYEEGGRQQMTVIICTPQDAS
jgi:hypothetical protein